MLPTIPITHYLSSSKQQDRTDVLSYYFMLITTVYNTMQCTTPAAIFRRRARELLRIIQRRAHTRVRGIACALKHHASLILCLTSLVLCRTEPRRALSQPSVRRCSVYSRFISAAQSTLLSFSTATSSPRALTSALFAQALAIMISRLVSSPSPVSTPAPR